MEISLVGKYLWHAALWGAWVKMRAGASRKEILGSRYESIDLACGPNDTPRYVMQLQ